MSAVKELRGIIKEKADGGDELAKGVQDTFGEKPDGVLVRFIRARKYDVARAFDLMKGGSLKCSYLSYSEKIWTHKPITSVYHLQYHSKQMGTCHPPQIFASTEVSCINSPNFAKIGAAIGAVSLGKEVLCVTDILTNEEAPTVYNPQIVSNR